VGGPDYLHGDEKAWSENKVSGNVSPHAMEEVKQKYQEVSNLCGISILSGEAQGLTMVGIEILIMRHIGDSILNVILVGAKYIRG